MSPKYNSSGIFIVDQSPFDEQSPTQNSILGRILPRSNIYNQVAFKIEIKLDDYFPLKPPEVRFLTPIHHPNVFDDGRISINILYPSGSWTVTSTLAEMVTQIVELIDHPNDDHAVNSEVAKEFLYDRAEFERKAKEMVRKHGLPRF